MIATTTSRCSTIVNSSVLDKSFIDEEVVPNRAARQACTACINRDAYPLSLTESTRHLKCKDVQYRESYNEMPSRRSYFTTRDVNFPTAASFPNVLTAAYATVSSQA